MRILSTLFIALVLSIPIHPAHADEAAGTEKTATLYKTPQCGCCESYADYLRDNGFKVTVKPTHDLPLIKDRHRVPRMLEGCHTMVLGDYVVEGHVPVSAIDRLLAEKPKIRGISLPGMPTGSPGMSGPKTQPFVIFEIGSEQSSGHSKVYTVE